MQCNVPRDAGDTTYYCALELGHAGDHAPHASVGDVAWTGEWREPSLEPAGPED